jgi:hypothetical protein
VESKHIRDCTAAERTERLKHAHQSMAAERKAALLRDNPGMTGSAAESKANREQERHTNRARAELEGRA